MKTLHDLLAAGNAMLIQLRALSGDQKDMMRAEAMEKWESAVKGYGQRDTTSDGKVLTDDHARDLARHFDAIRKEGYGFTHQQILQAAIVYARDHGYLAPEK